MSALRHYEYPGWGPFARDNMHYTQSVRVENRIICSGQGGWDPSNLNLEDIDANFPSDIAAEIDQAFRNVDTNLKHAGGKGWEQVYKVLTLSTDIPEQHEHIVRNLKKWMPGNLATWTEAGVSQLGAKAMRFEVEVEAYDPEGARKAEAQEKENA
jgi:enamine deaminase RidA (YjgF/YER057c/UK114 family)